MVAARASSTEQRANGRAVAATGRYQRHSGPLSGSRTGFSVPIEDTLLLCLPAQDTLLFCLPAQDTDGLVEEILELFLSLRYCLWSVGLVSGGSTDLVFTGQSALFR